MIKQRRKRKAQWTKDYLQTHSRTVWRMTERPAGCKQLSEPPLRIHCSLAKQPCEPTACTRFVHEKASWCVSLNHPFSLTGAHVGTLHCNGVEKLHVPKTFWLLFLWINPLFTPYFSTNSSNNIIIQMSPHTEPIWKRANDVNKTSLWQYFYRTWSAVPVVSSTSSIGRIFMLIRVRPFSQSSFIPPSFPFSTFWALAKGCMLSLKLTVLV